MIQQVFQNIINLLINNIKIRPDAPQITRKIMVISLMIDFAKEIPSEYRTEEINEFIDLENLMKSLLTGKYIYSFEGNQIIAPYLNLRNTDEFVEQINEWGSLDTWITILLRLHAVLMRRIKPELYAEVVEFEESMKNVRYIVVSQGQMTKLIIDDLLTLISAGKLDQSFASTLFDKLVKINSNLSI